MSTLDERLEALLADVRADIASTQATLAHLCHLEEGIMTALNTVPVRVDDRASAEAPVPPEPMLPLPAAVLTLVSGSGTRGLAYTDIKALLASRGYANVETRAGGLPTTVSNHVRYGRIHKMDGRFFLGNGRAEND